MIKKVFPVVALAVFSSMLGVGILHPILPIYAADLGATGVWIGIISGSYAVSRAVLMPLIGRWSDRRGRRVFLGAGLLLYTGVSLLYIFSDDLVSLLVIRLIHGAVSGMIIPVARAWTGDISPTGEEGRWQGYFNTALFSGSAAGPLLGGTLADVFDIDAAFAAMGIINFLSFLAVSIFLREAAGRKPADRPRPSFRRLGRSPLFQALFIQRATLEVGMATFIVFLPLFAYQELGLSRFYIGALLGVALLLTAWLQLLTGWLADKFDRRKLLIIGTFISFTVIALIPSAGSLVALVAIITIRSLGASLSMPGGAALSISLGHKFGMGSTIALLALSTSVGMGLGPILAGLVYDYLGGLDSVFYFAAGVGFTGIIFFTWLGHKEEPASEKASSS